jgi:hypothetical protein
VVIDEHLSRLLKKSFFAGCSKMPKCKAPEILSIRPDHGRSEAYLDVRRNDEGRGQRRRWAFFSSLWGGELMGME